MDKIKFRAWIKKEKKVVDINKLETYLDYCDPSMNDQWKTFYYEGGSALAKDCEIMQYIGIQDIDGVDIYEGDIFKHPDGNIFVVTYIKAVCAFRACYNNSVDDHGMISLQLGDKGGAVKIGDIYENPELLEGQNG